MMRRMIIVLILLSLVGCSTTYVGQPKTESVKGNDLFIEVIAQGEETCVSIETSEGAVVVGKSKVGMCYDIPAQNDEVVVFERDDFGAVLSAKIHRHINDQPTPPAPTLTP